MARRSASKRDDASLEIYLPQLEMPPSLLRQHLHFGLRAAKLRRRRAENVYALLEQRERGVQAGLFALESGKNLIESAKAFFEITLRRCLVWHDPNNIVAHSSMAQTGP